MSMKHTFTSSHDIRQTLERIAHLRSLSSWSARNHSDFIRYRDEITKHKDRVPAVKG